MGITWAKSDELVACRSSVNARLCCSRTVLNSSLIANGERRFMAAKRWPITETKEIFMLLYYTFGQINIEINIIINKHTSDIVH